MLPKWLERLQASGPVNEGAADRSAWTSLRKLRRSGRTGEPQVSLFLQTCILHGVCRYAPGRLRPQDAASRGVIDYSIQCERSKRIWIEVKRMGVSLRPDMILKYLDEAVASSFKAVLGVLTNGDEWEFWCGGQGLKALGVKPFIFARLAIASAEDFARLRLMFGASQVFRRYLQGVLSHVPARNALLKRERVCIAFEQGYRERFRGPIPSLARVLSPTGERVDPRIIAGRLVLFSSDLVRNALYRELRDHFDCRLRKFEIRDVQDGWAVDPLGEFTENL